MKKYLGLITLAVVLFLTAFVYSAAVQVQGKVMNTDGDPLAGASVLVKGTKKGTTTSAGGVFSLTVPSTQTVLVVSYPGLSTQEVTVGNMLVFSITLSPPNTLDSALSEVVVTGYAAPAQKVSRVMANTYNQKFTVPKLVRDEEVKSDYGVAHSEQFLDQRQSREGYDYITENNFRKTTDNPLSTFSIDVDAASYSNIRRMLNYNQLPPAGAVRIEEMINYFTYSYPQPIGNDPFSINTDIAACPWNEAHRLVSIGLQGKKIPTADLPAANITFLIDVSGSMDEEDKLPLVKSSLKMLAGQIRPQDKVAIVVYAGSAGLVLPATSDAAAIKHALEELSAGGSTAGGQGIQLAYATAQKNFVQGGNNRVVLCTDGDFNVGLSSDDELERLIELKRKTGIYLTVLGFGTGNYQDAKMQKLADKGNGNHAYIDNQNEAKKVLVTEFGGTLFTIAKDVKLQVEFNPALVQGYRLIGYENRMLAKEDFNDDKKDAGELGSGHTVTALYEIIPAGVNSALLQTVDPLKILRRYKCCCTAKL